MFAVVIMRRMLCFDAAEEAADVAAVRVLLFLLLLSIPAWIWDEQWCVGMVAGLAVFFVFLGLGGSLLGRVCGEFCCSLFLREDS